MPEPEEKTVANSGKKPTEEGEVNGTGELAQEDLPDVKIRKTKETMDEALLKRMESWGHHASEWEIERKEEKDFGGNKVTLSEHWKREPKNWFNDIVSSLVRLGLVAALVIVSWNLSRDIRAVGEDERAAWRSSSDRLKEEAKRIEAVASTLSNKAERIEEVIRDCEKRLAERSASGDMRNAPLEVDVFLPPGRRMWHPNCIGGCE